MCGWMEFGVDLSIRRPSKYEFCECQCRESHSLRKGVYLIFPYILRFYSDLEKFTTGDFCKIIRNVCEMR